MRYHVNLTEWTREFVKDARMVSFKRQEVATGEDIQLYLYTFPSGYVLFEFVQAVKVVEGERQIFLALEDMHRQPHEESLWPPEAIC